MLSESLETLVLPGWTVHLSKFLSIPTSPIKNDLSRGHILPLGPYDVELTLGSADWSYLVNLKKINPKRNLLISLKGWTPPSNLREMNMMIDNFLPKFPSMLNSLRIVSLALTEATVKVKMQRPPNSHTSKCIIKVREFVVPPAICFHQLLVRWELERDSEIPAFRMRFPPKIRGNLALRVLDVKGGLKLRRSERGTSYEVETLCNNMERALGRAVVSRLEDVNRIHILCPAQSNKRRKTLSGQPVPAWALVTTGFSPWRKVYHLIILYTRKLSSTTLSRGNAQSAVCHVLFRWIWAYITYKFKPFRSRISTFSRKGYRHFETVSNSSDY